MKKVSKSNPLKTFNDNKAMAHKKAGGAMSEYKKYLKKAQYGQATSSLNGYNTYEGPVSKETTDALNKNYPAGVGPRIITPEVTQADNMKLMGENFDRIPQTNSSASKKVKRKVAGLGRPKEFSMSFNKVGGSTKKALGGVANDPTKKEVRKEMRAVNKMDRQDKKWNRKEDRIQAREERKTNKENAKILMASKRF